jgi:hypothetical protein
MLPYFVIWIPQSKTLDTILVWTQPDDFVLGVISQNALDGITRRLGNMDEEKLLLERDHRLKTFSGCKITLGAREHADDYFART